MTRQEVKFTSEATSAHATVHLITALRFVNLVVVSMSITPVNALGRELVRCKGVKATSEATSTHTTIHLITALRFVNIVVASTEKVMDLWRFVRGAVLARLRAGCTADRITTRSVATSLMITTMRHRIPIGLKVQARQSRP